MSNKSPIPASPMDQNNSFNGLLTNDSNENLVPWKSFNGIIYELPQQVVTEISGYRNASLQEIQNINETTQVCINSKSIIEQQAKELARCTKVAHAHHSIPNAGQLNKKVHINDTFYINYFNNDFQPSLGTSTLTEPNIR